MKVKAIMEKAAREQVKYDVAIKIRELLDEAKKAYGPGWDEDGIEDQIEALVFEEDDG